MMKLADLHLLDLDNSALEATDFYSAYSSLSFNRGIIFKRIGTQPENLLADFLEKIDKKVFEVIIQNTGTVKRIEANTEVYDVIFDLLTHKDVYKKWKYNDDEFFTEISPEFNSQERFRKIGLFEINIEDFANRLLLCAVHGSCNDSMNNYSEQEIKNMVDNFIHRLLTDPADRVIVSTQPWGEYLIGWFTCFFIIRKTDIVIFGVDDYD